MAVLTPANSLSKNVSIQTVIESELELDDIERKVLAADFVVGAHPATLNQTSEAFSPRRLTRLWSKPRRLPGVRPASPLGAGLSRGP